MGWGKTSWGKRSRRARGCWAPVDTSAARAAPGTLQMLSHDVRHGVGTILVLVAAGRTQLGDTPALADCLEAIRFEAQLVGGLCRHALMEPPVEQPVRVDAIADGVVRVASSLFTGVIRTCLKPVSVLGDEFTVGRLLTNVVDNACNAAGADGQVLVAVGKRKNAVSVRVQNSGRSFGDARSGVGLEIVHEAARQLGGTVRIETAAHRGTRVEIALPAVHTWEMAAASGSTRDRVS
jgi:signal transduction histidine kinase